MGVQVVVMFHSARDDIKQELLDEGVGCIWHFEGPNFELDAIDSELSRLLTMRSLLKVNRERLHRSHPYSFPGTVTTPKFPFRPSLSARSS